MLPLFGALPGAPELLVLLLVLLLMLAVPLAIAVGLFLLGRWSASRGGDVNEEQLAALRERVDELETRLREERDDASPENQSDAPD